jgi:hypothetical protein
MTPPLNPVSDEVGYVVESYLFLTTSDALRGRRKEQYRHNKAKIEFEVDKF